MIGSGYLITMVAYPTEILVLASVGVALFDFLMALVLDIVFGAIAGVTFSAIAGIMQLIICCHVLFTLALSLLGHVDRRLQQTPRL